MRKLLGARNLAAYATVAGVIVGVVGAGSPGVAVAATSSSCSNPSVGAEVPVDQLGVTVGYTQSTWIPSTGPSSCSLSATNVTGVEVSDTVSPITQMESDGPHFVASIDVRLTDNSTGAVLYDMQSGGFDISAADWAAGIPANSTTIIPWYDVMPVWSTANSGGATLPATASLDATCTATAVGTQGSYSCALS